jgi:hypothetical protein
VKAGAGTRTYPSDFSAPLVAIAMGAFFLSFREAIHCVMRPKCQRGLAVQKRAIAQFRLKLTRLGVAWRLRQDASQH